MTNIVKVSTAAQIKELSELADEIWHESYISIISKEQIDYMLNKYLTPEAVKRQMAEGYDYYLAEKCGAAIGFVSVKPDGERLFLSKLYLEKAQRGKGYGSRMLLFVEGLAHGMGKNAVYLTVNKHNAAYEVYKARGFTVEKSVITEIGDGYVMDDYIMVKPL